MPAAAKKISVVDRIMTYRSQMPATISKIAAVLLEDPRAPLDLSITELAKRAGDATRGHAAVIRAGCSGSDDFRDAGDV